jgi:hypothetical protein
MNLNNKHIVTAWFLSIAFLLPILIKSEHMMFPNHEHHCSTCSHHPAELAGVCAIQDFDYFFFTPADIICPPHVVSFLLQIQQVESVQNSCRESDFSYSLRAPPIKIS